jgi:hypothetical protein
MLLQKISKWAAAAMLSLAVLAIPGVLQAQQAGDTVLKPAEMEKLLPARVYYRGQTATTQLRNSGGVKFADGYYMLATLVDTSGYSTDVATKYQAYLIAEVALKVGGQDLPAGVYGVGFVGENKFVVTDIGGHDLLTVSSGDDQGIKRPTPLQVVADPAGGFRLYAGRRYILFSR